jgi:hypothetical protein
VIIHLTYCAVCEVLSFISLVLYLNSTFLSGSTSGEYSHFKSTQLLIMFIHFHVNLFYEFLKQKELLVNTVCGALKNKTECMG